MLGLSLALLQLPGIFLGLMGLAWGSPWALSGASWNESIKYASLVPILEFKKQQTVLQAVWQAGWLVVLVLAKKIRNEVFNVKSRPPGRLLGCFLAAPELCLG